jgi:hypothetical protein
MPLYIFSGKEMSSKDGGGGGDQITSAFSNLKKPVCEKVNSEDSQVMLGAVTFFGAVFYKHKFTLIKDFESIYLKQKADSFCNRERECVCVCVI